jgi:hypothetical protein
MNDQNLATTENAGQTGKINHYNQSVIHYNMIRRRFYPTQNSSFPPSIPLQKCIRRYPKSLTQCPNMMGIELAFVV